MFFLVKLKTNIPVEPQSLCFGINTKIINKLKQLVEGKLHLHYGFIIKIIKIISLINKSIDIHNGDCIFEVNYEVMTFHPMENQVIDGIVDIINKFGIYVKASMVNIYISGHSMVDELEYNDGYAENIYISKLDSNIRIAKDDLIRCKIISIKKEKSSFNAIGTLKGMYLGPFQ